MFAYIQEYINACSHNIECTQNKKELNCTALATRALNYAYYG